MKNRINLILVCILLSASSVMSQHILTSKEYEARKVNVNSFQNYAITKNESVNCEMASRHVDTNTRTNECLLLNKGRQGAFLSGNNLDSDMKINSSKTFVIDLAATGVSPSGMVMPGDIITPSVTVHNNDSETVCNFTVEVVIDDDANTIYSASKNISTQIYRIKL